MAENDFLNNPAFKNIDKNKLELLLNLTNQASTKSQDDILPFLMSAFSGENAIDFNDEETNLILETLKPNMTPKEIKKIETIKKMTKLIAEKSKSSAKR